MKIFKYNFNDIAIRKAGFNVADFFILLHIYHAGKIKYNASISQRLFDEQWLGFVDGVVYMINTEKFEDAVNKLSLVDGEKTKKEFIVLLASKMKELFPKGMKEGTNQAWRGNSATVALKLEKFFEKYGFFDEDTILDATARYIKSYNGNTELMRILPYFIEKDSQSDLLTKIENPEDETINTGSVTDSLYSLNTVEFV